MSSFRTLQARHEELIHKVQEGQSVVEAAQQFIDEVKAASSQIGSTSERDQLRSNLRYWASYIYEHTQSYPNVDLAPSDLTRRTSLLLPASIGAGVLLLLIFLGTRLFGGGNAQVDPTTEAVETFLPTQPPLAATDTPFPEPVEEPPTATPTLELPITGGDPGNAISIEILSVRDGDVVSPLTQLSGTYTNLPGGSSIHVLIQPLSEGGVRYPARQYATVSANSPSGEWSIEAVFGQRAALREKEDYLISVVAAADEQARQALVEAAETGLQELPPGVLPFPQTVSVQRAAYSTVIDGVRLIYSSYLDDEGNFEIFSAELDGSDPRRITFTSGVSEIFPSLSPDGKRIVYVARRRDANRSPVYSLEIINSDGTSPETLLEQQKEKIYESPLWSSDSAYIAYAIGDLTGGGQTTWDVAVYDLARKQEQVLLEGNTFGPRYIDWVPDTHDLIYNARITERTGTSGFRRIDIVAPDEPSLFFDDRGEELQPSLSPDGTTLVYMQLDNGIGNIYTVDLATGNIQQLTRNQLTGSSPVWAPDGRTIFFQFYGEGAFNIWTVDVDNRELVQLTFGTQDVHPSAGYMFALVP